MVDTPRYPDQNRYSRSSGRYHARPRVESSLEDTAIESESSPESARAQSSASHRSSFEPDHTQASPADHSEQAPEMPQGFDSYLAHQQSPTSNRYERTNNRYAQRRPSRGQQRVRPVQTRYNHATFHESDPRVRSRNADRAAAGGYSPEEAAHYADLSRYRQKRKKKPMSKAAIVAIVLVIIFGGVGAWFVLNPPTFNANINGTVYTLNRGTTLNDVIEEGYATPVAGNLLAVDGSVLEAGAGDAFSATVNNNSTTDGTTVLHKDDVVQIDNGGDVTEPSTSEQVTVTPEYESGGSGAVHAYIQGQDGVSQRLTGSISGKTVDEVVQPVVNGGFKKYNIDTNGEKVIALTFDDGPWPTTTQQILDILAENGAKATFFTIGNQIADHADTVKAAAAAGHQICTHTWDHADGSGQGVNLTYMSTQEQIDEVQKGYEAIKEATGAEASNVIRAPGGNFYGDIIETLEPYISAEIGWNIDTEDWRRPGSETIATRVKSAEPGDIILMHDGGGDRSQTVEALKTALPYLKQQGYKFVTIDELMKYTDPASITIDE